MYVCEFRLPWIGSLTPDDPKGKVVAKYLSIVVVQYWLREDRHSCWDVFKFAPIYSFIFYVKVGASNYCTMGFFIYYSHIIYCHQRCTIQYDQVS